MCGELDLFLANMGPGNPFPNFRHLSGFLTACWGLALAVGMVCGGMWLVNPRREGRPLRRRPDWGLWTVVSFGVCLCLSCSSHIEAQKELLERRKQAEADRSRIKDSKIPPEQQKQWESDQSTTKQGSPER